MILPRCSNKLLGYSVSSLSLYISYQNIILVDILMEIDDFSSKHMLAMTDFIRLDPHLFMAKSLF